jgi:hypothetical protein
MLEPRVLLELRVSNVHHHHARQAPHDHQHADSDAKVAMNQEKQPDHGYQYGRFVALWWLPFSPTVNLCNRALPAQKENV